MSLAGESIKKRRIGPILLMSEALIIQRKRRLVNAIPPGDSG
jgi:hypothetical protein